MQPNTTDVAALALAATSALQKGDAQRAADLYKQVVAAGRADISIWLGLAAASRQIGDTATKLSAINRALSADPVNLQALIMKGDHFMEANDNRAAVSFYRSAIKRVTPRDKFPPALLNDLRRAQQACADYAKQYEEYLVSRLTERGFSPERSSARFAQSIDLLLGKRRIFYQQPQHFYFPELPQIQFYERSALPWLDDVEAATGDIRAELSAVLKKPEEFAPYVEHYQNRPNIDASGMIENDDWSAFFLWKNGQEVPENAARCPKTMAALAKVPFDRIPGRTPSILFSALRPGAKIPPHHGMLNTRLVCHLPLIVPEGCGFRVGNEMRPWVEGKAWAFDDTIEHEAWNNSDKLRVVLIFDVWRPELSADECALVTAMIESIDAFSGQAAPESGGA